MYKTKSFSELSINKKSLNILIVDDDLDAGKYFKTILELRNHNVTILNEGVRCISKCLNNHYDIIFMDYHIDGINGDEITDIIKNDYSNKSQIFAYTGDKSDSAINNFKESGMYGAIIKPVNMDLFNEVMNILEKDTVNIDKAYLKRISRRSRGNILVF
jgi:CheY-like chemotaxis protein